MGAGCLFYTGAVSCARSARRPVLRSWIVCVRSDFGEIADSCRPFATLHQ